MTNSNGLNLKITSYLVIGNWSKHPVSIAAQFDEFTRAWLNHVPFQINSIWMVTWWIIYSETCFTRQTTITKIDIQWYNIYRNWWNEKSIQEKWLWLVMIIHETIRMKKWLYVQWFSNFRVWSANENFKIILNNRSQSQPLFLYWFFLSNSHCIYCILVYWPLSLMMVACLLKHVCC